MKAEREAALPTALYVVATPLGNLGDITARAREVLARVAVVAAEDTRHSQRLLDALGIRARMMALHEHNEQQAVGALLEHLQAGAAVALITDAGTPAISDPGARAVARVQAAGFTVTPVPGPCAAVAALSASGLVGTRFDFVGFLPPRAQARRAAIAALREREPVQVLYEAPHRIVECVADLRDVLGGAREIVFARELTKLHEEIARMSLADAPAWLAADANRQRGEYVLLLAGAPPQTAEAIGARETALLRALAEHLPPKTAAAIVAGHTGLPKKRLYEILLAQKD